jgi:hypothetical protein
LTVGIKDANGENVRDKKYNKKNVGTKSGNSCKSSDKKYIHIKNDM